MSQSLFALTIFLSAFLIFFIQPLLAKSLLPSFGGSVFVWVVSMLFFQFGLLLGYAYAYVVSRISIRWQVIIHISLLAISFYYIRNTLPAFDWQEAGWPPLQLFTLLCGKILLPFSILSATSPLFQSWYCKIKQTDFPYYFYSISNAGSLIGLFGFPLFFELWFALNNQMLVWNGLYGVYAILTLLCAIPVIHLIRAPHKIVHQKTEEVDKIPNFQIFLWLALTFLSSAFMLATSNFILQNIINMPLIWILPLALFLVSYIVTFAREKKYQREFWALSIAIWLIIFSWAIYKDVTPNNLINGTAILLALLYSCCMFCHGELIQLKPPVSQLTLFYLLIALGGVLGGLFVTIGGYWLFNDLWDYYIPLIIIAFSSLVILYQAYKNKPSLYRFATVLISAFGIAFVIFVKVEPLFQKDISLVDKRRNAFGMIRVSDVISSDPTYHKRKLVHGPILHGVQFLDKHMKKIPTTYYGTISGVGIAASFLRDKHKDNLNIAVIGLGTGTIAALTKEKDKIDFYDIDKDIIEISQQYFSFLKDSPAKYNLYLGDGRIELQKKLNKQGPRQYDLIVLDAFNGDSIPFHLITLEAIKVYEQLLKPNGIIAYHISNKFINLVPVTKALANEIDSQHFIVYTAGDIQTATNASAWVLISNHQALAPWLYQLDPDIILSDKQHKPRLWTDLKNSMLPLLVIKE